MIKGHDYISDRQGMAIYTSTTVQGTESSQSHDATSIHVNIVTQLPVDVLYGVVRDTQVGLP
jgi:hypothetical protein